MIFRLPKLAFFSFFLFCSWFLINYVKILSKSWKANFYFVSWIVWELTNGSFDIRLHLFSSVFWYFLFPSLLPPTLTWRWEMCSVFGYECIIVLKLYFEEKCLTRYVSEGYYWKWWILPLFVGTYTILKSLIFLSLWTIINSIRLSSFNYFANWLPHHFRRH